MDNKNLKNAETTEGIEYIVYNITSSGKITDTCLNSNIPLYGDFDYPNYLNAHGYTPRKVVACNLILLGQTKMYHDNFDVCAQETGEKIYTGHTYFEDGFLRYPVDLKRVYEATGSANFKIEVDEDFCNEIFWEVKSYVEVEEKPIKIINAKELKIEISTPPDKTIYIEDERFEEKGMSVRALYSNSVYDTVKNFTIRQKDVPLKAGQKFITVLHNGLVCNLPITVLPKYNAGPTGSIPNKLCKLVSGERSSKNFGLPNGIKIKYNIIDKSLAYCFNDLSGRNTYLGLDISHIYRCGRENIGFGKGFALNICECLKKKDEKIYYTDGAGICYEAENDCVKDMIYTAEEPPSLNRIPLYVEYRDNPLPENIDNLLPVEWLVGTSLIRGFNKFGKLVMISDYSGNYYEFYYDAFDKITKINCNDILNTTDAYNLKYNSQGLLSEISRRNDVITFTYSDGYLTTITNNGVKQTLTYSGEIISEIESSDKYLTTVSSDKDSDIIVSVRSTVNKVPDGLNLKYNDALSKWRITIGNTTEIKDIDGNSEFYKLSNISENVRYVASYFCQANGVVTYAEKYVFRLLPNLSLTVQFADRADLFKKPFSSFIFNVTDLTESYRIDYNEKNQPQKEICKNIKTADNCYLESTNTFTRNEETGLVTKEETRYSIANGDTLNTYIYVTEFDYDSYNRLVKRTAYFEEEAETEGKDVREYAYNENGQGIKVIYYNSLEPDKAHVSENSYNELGRLESVKYDPFIPATAYAYSGTETQPYSVVSPCGIISEYNRDGRNRPVNINFFKSNVPLDGNSLGYCYDEVTSLACDGKEIEYVYDSDRRVQKILVDGSVYEEFTYDDRDNYGNLKNVISLTLKNAAGETYKAEADKRFTYCKKYYGNSLKAEAEFNEYGDLTKFTDAGVAEYVYSDLGLLTDYTYGKDNEAVYSEKIVYNMYGSVAEITQSGAAEFSCKYRYGGSLQRKLKDITISEQTVITPEYDKSGGNVGRKVERDGNEILSEKINYGEKPYVLDLNGETRTLRYKSYMPAEFKYTVGSVPKSIAYNYDERGNIKTVNGGTGKLAEYAYDDANRLIREDNQALDRTYVYEYDGFGNITKKSEYKYKNTVTALKTDAYKYGDGKLVQINDGAFILYDKLGNPKQYNGKQLVWQGGKLTAYGAITFTYDGQGRRTGKGGTEYCYDSQGRLVKENGISYFYDHTGVAGFKTGFDTYYYVKDAQRNIIAVVNSAGEPEAEYVYDAWGNCTVTKNVGGTAEINPYRYRGYYYDEETGLYYLQARYYDPRTGRFLNADSVEYADPETLNGLNLYAYCGNNPVMGFDPTGEFALSTAVGLGIIAAVAAVLGLIEITFHPIQNAIQDIGNAVGDLANDITINSGSGNISAGNSFSCLQPDDLKELIWVNNEFLSLDYNFNIKLKKPSYKPPRRGKRVRNKSKKEAEEAARRRGGGRPPRHHKGGFDKKLGRWIGPHFHPGVPERHPFYHDHYFYLIFFLLGMGYDD